MNSNEIKELLEEAQDENPKVSKAALLRLCPCQVRANRKEVWNLILAMSKDDDAGIRSVVLHNLCDGSHREREDKVVEVLEHLANDEDKKLRRRARNSLAIYNRTGIVNSE